MKIEIIPVNKKKLKIKPNLKNYESTYRKFKWKGAEKELEFFSKGKINAAYNAIEKHLSTWRKNKVALYWEGADSSKKEYSFLEIAELSNKFANVLKKYDIKKGDRCFIFLPRIPELYISFLGILKTGAIAGTMFSAFGPEGIRDRLQDSEAKFLITDSELLKRVYEAAPELPDLKYVFILNNSKQNKKNNKKKEKKVKFREIDYEEEMQEASDEFKIASMKPEEPAYMLYTSGTTGKPKGVVHSHIAILTEHMTAKWVLDIKDNDIMWCVPPKTNIIANPGPKNIEEIRVGDRVLSHNGEFCKVLQLFKRKYEGNLIKIKTYYSDEFFLLTPNHSVLSGQRGKKAIRWVPVEKLTKRDFILFPRARRTGDINSINLSSFVKGCKAINEYAYRRKVKTKIKNEVKVDKRFMKLVGYYLAEGSLSSHARVIQFSFSKKEEHLANDVKKLLKYIFCLDSSKIFHKDLFEIRACSVIVGELFKNLFGGKSHEKRLPEWVLYLSDKKLSEFLKGFWLGDGNMDRDSFRFHTTSKTLAYQLKVILSRLGIVASLTCRKKETIPISQINGRQIHAKNDCYCVKVGGKSLIKLSKILSRKHPFIDKRWCTYHLGNVTNNYIWMPIHSIEKIPYKGYVYNIKTEAGSYVLSNMIVHNCTADPGWVTGVAYELLGSWSNGVSQVVYEGRFDAAKWYEIIERYKVTVWYTAPTAIRLLAAAGDIYKKYDLSSLRHLCSVGEPLNPQPIKFGMKAYKLPFHDNWWQTETGGILIANYPCMPIKLGSMGKPVPGIKARIVDDKGNELPTGKIGNLAIKPGWPSMMLKIWHNRKKYNSYFVKGWYITGDLAYCDKQNYFWFVGRADDVIKTSGERVGPFEVESALVEHPAVVEAGVIGKPDPEGIRGEIIKAFIVLKQGFKPSKKLEDELKEHVKKRLAGHAYPREFEFIEKLPKTRSGKIMRRLLKAKELGLPIGDISTLEEY